MPFDVQRQNHSIPKHKITRLPNFPPSSSLHNRELSQVSFAFAEIGVTFYVSVSSNGSSSSSVLDEWSGKGSAGYRLKSEREESTEVALRQRGFGRLLLCLRVFASRLGSFGYVKVLNFWRL